MKTGSIFAGLVGGLALLSGAGVLYLRPSVSGLPLLLPTAHVQFGTGTAGADNGTADQASPPSQGDDHASQSDDDGQAAGDTASSRIPSTAALTGDAGQADASQSPDTGQPYASNDGTTPAKPEASNPKTADGGGNAPAPSAGGSYSSAVGQYSGFSSFGNGLAWNAPNDGSSGSGGSGSFTFPPLAPGFSSSDGSTGSGGSGSSPSNASAGTGSSGGSNSSGTGSASNGGPGNTGYPTGDVGSGNNGSGGTTTASGSGDAGGSGGTTTASGSGDSGGGSGGSGGGGTTTASGSGDGGSGSGSSGGTTTASGSGDSGSGTGGSGGSGTTTASGSGDGGSGSGSGGGSGSSGGTTTASGSGDNGSGTGGSGGSGTTTASGSGDSGGGSGGAGSGSGTITASGSGDSGSGSGGGGTTPSMLGRTPTNPMLPLQQNADGSYVLSVDTCISSDCPSNGWEFFDPNVVTGFDVKVLPNAGQTTPSYGIVDIQVPTIIGTGVYSLWLCDTGATTCEFNTGQQIIGNGGNTNQDIFDVVAYLDSLTQTQLDELGITDPNKGISEFALRGIDPNAGLDPNAAQQFVIGLLFTPDDGANHPDVNLLITPEVTDPPGNSVPEPGSLALFASALLLGGWRWKRRAASLPSAR